MPSDDESIACENELFRTGHKAVQFCSLSATANSVLLSGAVLNPKRITQEATLMLCRTLQLYMCRSRKAERQLGAITHERHKVTKQQSLGPSQKELLQAIASSSSGEGAECREGRDGSPGVVLAVQQQLGMVAEEHAKKENPQTQACYELVQDVISACASSLGTLCAYEVDALRAMLPGDVQQEFRDIASQAIDGPQTSNVVSVLPLAIAALWHCVLEERVSAAVSSIGMLRPSQRLPQEERATLFSAFCCVSTVIIQLHLGHDLDGHGLLRRCALSLIQRQVRSGSEDLTVDADSNPMMRSMMQKLYHVSQAFNKAGRSKLLVPVDVALENHFADDQGSMLQAHLPLMRRGFAAEDAWQAFMDVGKPHTCLESTAAPSSTALTRAADKENKSKASGSTRTGQTLRRARSDPLPDAGAALAVKSMRAKVQGLQRRALSKKGKLVLRTHHHLVPRMAMPTQVTTKSLPSFTVAKRPKKSSRSLRACPMSVIPDTEKVARACCWGTPNDAIKKRLDFHAFEDADHGALQGLTAEDFAMFPAVDLPVMAEQKKTIFTMH